MDITRAKEILFDLADGIDPFTGEILPERSICNQAQVVRAFHCILKELERPVKEKRPQPVNAGKPWTDIEMDKLEDEFQTGMKLPAIAKEHGRTRGAIESQLNHMGLVTKERSESNLKDPGGK